LSEANFVQKIFALVYCRKITKISRSRDPTFQESELPKRFRSFLKSGSLPNMRQSLVEFRLLALLLPTLPTLKFKKM